MPAPGSPGGMGGMQPPGGEVPEELAQMMSGSGPKTSSGSSSLGGNPSSGKMDPAQLAAAQQMAGKMGGGQPSSTQPREVGTLAEEFKRSATDIFTGLKDFFKLNTWLGIEPATLDPQQQAQAQQLHSRFQQLDQEQKMVAQQMYQEKMQQKKLQEEEAARKKQMEQAQAEQSFAMPSGPQKGPVGPASGKSKKQNVMTKLKQDRTTLNNVQGE